MDQFDQLYLYSKRVGPVLDRRIRQFVKPIAIRGSGPIGEGGWAFATGQVVHVAGRFFLVTASHAVFGDDDKILDIALSPTGTFDENRLEWLNQPDRPRGSIRDFIDFNEDTDREVPYVADVAVVELTGKEVRRNRVKPIPIEWIAPNLVSPRSHCFVLGYPRHVYDVSRASEGRLTAKYVSFITFGAPGSCYPSGWDKRLHRIFVYPNEGTERIVGQEGVPETLPPPGGFSGSAMWVFDPRLSSTLLDPDALVIVGILTSSFREEEILVGAHASPGRSAVPCARPARPGGAPRP